MFANHGFTFQKHIDFAHFRFNKTSAQRYSFFITFYPVHQKKRFIGQKHLDSKILIIMLFSANYDRLINRRRRCGKNQCIA